MHDDISVRIGTPADLDEVMALAQMMHEEIGLTAFEAGKVLPEIYAALHKDHGLMGLIGAPDGPVEAGILLVIGKFFYSDEDVLEERGLFVHPEYRQAKGGRAARLCEFAKHAADRLGMLLHMGVFNDVNADAKLRLYRRQFGEPAGAFFLYRPQVAATLESEAA
jgi:GNAT superfamily N-acetyltransferase